MSRALRVIAAVAIATLACWAAYSSCYRRYVCNRRELGARDALTRLFAISNQTTARIVARQVVDVMDECIPVCPTDVANLMIRAAALRMLDRLDDAAAEYRSALRLDPRAEIYLQLGLTELDAGHARQAEDALTTAVFLIYSYSENIPQPMQETVKAKVRPIYDLMRRHSVPPELRRQLRERVSREPL